MLRADDIPYSLVGAVSETQDAIMMDNRPHSASFGNASSSLMSAIVALRENDASKAIAHVQGAKANIFDGQTAATAAGISPITDPLISVYAPPLIALQSYMEQRMTSPPSQNVSAPSANVRPVAYRSAYRGRQGNLSPLFVVGALLVLMFVVGGGK